MPEKAHEEEEKAKRSWRTKTRKTPGNPPIGSEEKAQDLKLVAELALGDAGRDRMAGQWGSSLRKSAIGDVEEIELAKGEFLQTDERGGGAPRRSRKSRWDLPVCTIRVRKEMEAKGESWNRQKNWGTVYRFGESRR